MDEQLSDREAIIARYADGPNQLETAIAGLSAGDSISLRATAPGPSDRLCITSLMGMTSGRYSLRGHRQPRRQV